MGIVALLIGAGIILILFKKPMLRSYYRVDYETFILREARANSLSPHLLAAVIFTESRFRHDAISEVGAHGLMQLMPETAKEMAGKADMKNFRSTSLSDPEINIHLGARYLAELKKLFPKDDSALAAYNAGPTAVHQWLQRGEGIVYQETKEYVEQVQHHREVLEGLYPEWRTNAKGTPDSFGNSAK